jgi:DNA ligase-1
MEPTTIFTHETLYKRGSGGEVRCWRMELGSWDNDVGGHRVVSGILNGTETSSGWSMPEGKNLGKKNATNAFTQAKSEVLNNYAIKRSRGYFDDVAEIDNVPFTKPMLATKWEDRKDKVSVGKDSVALQPKLDGIRCIARVDGLWTRTGQVITACPHILAALAPLFVNNPDIILDGELYNHSLKDDFNTITSIVRKEKPSPSEVLLAEEMIQYHVYDMVDGVPFADRLKALTELFSSHGLAVYGSTIQLVPTFTVDNTEFMDKLYGDWMAEGYEGQMVRLNGPYENKRSNGLMKRKDFDTDEFSVVSVEEGDGNWAGCIKRFVVKLPDGSTCEATPRGTQGKLRELLQSGKTPDWATVRYFGYTPAGKLRFGIVIDYGYGVRKD